MTLSGSTWLRCRAAARRLAPAIGVALLFAAAVAPARAELIDEIQVYIDDLEDPGHLGLQMHLNTTPSGRSAPDYPGEITPAHGVRLTPEFAYGLTPDLEAGLYLPLDYNPGQGPYLAGMKLRLKYVPLRPAKDGAGWFAGANLELSDLERRFDQNRWALELRPIVGWRNRDWLIAGNPVLGKALAGPDRSESPEFEPSIKAGRRVAEGIMLGLEYYLDVGPVSATLPASQQAQQLFLAVDVDRGPLNLNFGVGRGLNDATDGWTVKAIFEVPLP